MKEQNAWRMFKIKSQMNFELTGILNQVLISLSGNDIGIFAISTYDTDYVLVQEKDYDKLIAILKGLFEIEEYAD